MLTLLQNNNGVIDFIQLISIILNVFSYVRYTGKNTCFENILSVMQTMKYAHLEFTPSSHSRPFNIICRLIY